jgi:predicted phage tail protein
VTAKSAADTTKTASATVTVTATQLLSASPTSLSFGSVLVGNTASQTVTLSNTGGGSVTVSAANFTGGVFNASGLTLPLTLAAGATTTVAINFVPGVSGPASGSVSFVSNATNSPATVTLSGTGVAPQPHSVDLSWVGSPSTGVVGYYVYRSTTSGSGYAKLNASSVAPTTTYTDSTVQSGTTYYYVVTAVDGSGSESAFSNQATAVIPTP